MRHPFARLIITTLLSISAISAAPTDSSPALRDLLKREWDWSMEQSPTWASQLGDRRWNDRWPDLSAAANTRRNEHRKAVLKELDAIGANELSPRDRLNLDLFRRGLLNDISEFEFNLHLLPINQRGGIQTEDEEVDQLRFQTVKDYEDWIARLNAFPAYMAQTIELLREGTKDKVVQPRVIMQRVPAQIDHQIVEDATASNFYKPFRRFPETIPTADRDRLETAAALAIERKVVPAFRELKKFFEAEYLPACFKNVGAWQLPRGDELYAFVAKQHTTTDLSPEQIHQIGLAEVARIRGEMEKVKEQAGFTGSLEEFFTFLRTDKRFFYSSGDELLAASRALAKTIDPKLVKLFRILPRMPYGVEPIPENIAPDTTTAYYQQPAADGSRAGTYYVNLYKPETRPKWEMPALTLHEAVPGHHLQISRAMELGEQPEFRRYGGYSAFVEGWALYCESMGEEIGMYEDPYDRFGRLTYEMWRAVRLVVDTGMHHKHWSRQQAIDYFKANAPKSDLDITNEIDRYIGWPGQALAYKVGELKIKELRKRAEAELGDKFDVRDFNDTVIGQGAVPLDELERIVVAWIEKQKKR